MSSKQVVVFGSINLDLTVRVKRLPTKGETLRGKSFATTGGGKGANQAVALARLGIPTTLIGRVGNDNFGQQLKNELAQNQVKIEAIGVDSHQTTGTAIIAVEETGENQIIIVAGANGNLDETDLANLKQVLPTSAYLLLQLEIPLEIAIKAIEIASEYDVAVILDPAPALDLPEEIYSKIKIVTPNIIEAGQLVGFTLENTEDVEKASLLLLDKGVETVIITMGNRGVFCATNDQQFFVSAPPSINVIDTVGAGDAFNGGLTMALISNHSLKEAVKWGVIASSLSVTKAGAQSSFPTRDEIENSSFILEDRIIDR